MKCAKADSCEKEKEREEGDGSVEQSRPGPAGTQKKQGKTNIGDKGANRKLANTTDLLEKVKGWRKTDI